MGSFGETTMSNSLRAARCKRWARLAYVLGDSDPEGAIYWDTRAAELGYVPSMCNLAARSWLHDTRECGTLVAPGSRVGITNRYGRPRVAVQESRPTEADRWRQRQRRPATRRLSSGTRWRHARWVIDEVHSLGTRKVPRSEMLVRCSGWRLLPHPYELGPDVPTKNHRRALSLLTKSAGLGDPYAQFLLAVSYVLGILADSGCGPTTLRGPDSF